MGNFADMDSHSLTPHIKFNDVELNVELRRAERSFDFWRNQTGRLQFDTVCTEKKRERKNSRVSSVCFRQWS
jgi:hypothetical protein